MANNHNSMDEMTKKETAQYAHQRVLDFTFSCDNKASFLLAFIGVVLTVITTAEQFTRTFSIIIASLKSYWVENEDMVIDWGKCVTGASAVAFYVLFAIALYFLLASLTANTNSNEQDSLLFFGTIVNGRSSANDYVNAVKSAVTSKSLEDDLLKQTYRCSEICVKKYKNYGKAVRCVKLGVGALLIFIVLSFILF